MRNIYIVLSQTMTKFGRAIRRVGGLKFNHTAIVLDDDFENWFSFARKHHCAVLTGGLVKESIQRYTLKRNCLIESRVFCIPVTDEQYDRLVYQIKRIAADKEYIYNLFSVLTYPMLRGLNTYKAFTCAEFVAFLLTDAGIMELEERHRCTPDRLGRILEKYQVYSGDLVDYVSAKAENEEVTQEYFSSFSRVDLKESVVNVFRLFSRLFFRAFYSS